MIILFVPAMMITYLADECVERVRIYVIKFDFFINCNKLLNLSTKYSIIQYGECGAKIVQTVSIPSGNTEKPVQIKTHFTFKKGRRTKLKQK